jgi:hypothetical protein
VSRQWIGTPRIRRRLQFKQKAFGHPQEDAAITAGAPVGGGPGVTSLQNERGVTIPVTAMRSGLALTLAPPGMTITAAR